MRDGDRAAAAIILGCPLVLVLAMLVRGSVGWSGWAGAWQTAQLLGWAGAALLVVSVGSRARQRLATLGGRKIVVHTHGGHGTWTAAKHEAGHFETALAQGATVGKAVINPDGSGYTELWMPRKATAAQHIAVDVAGEVAAGTSAGCGYGMFWPVHGSDAWYQDTHLRPVPRAEHARTRREGFAIARAVCRKGRTHRTAKRIFRDGEIRA